MALCSAIILAFDIQTSMLRVLRIWNKALRTLIWWKTNKPTIGIVLRDPTKSRRVKSRRGKLFWPNTTTSLPLEKSRLLQWSLSLALSTQWKAVKTCLLVIRAPPQLQKRPPGYFVLGLHNRTILRGEKSSFEKYLFFIFEERFLFCQYWRG